MPDEIEARENTKRLMLLIFSILVVLVCAGTGGYALKRTKDLIELHGGTLDIDSEVGVGTIVTVLLPDKVPESKHAQHAGDASPKRELEPAG